MGKIVKGVKEKALQMKNKLVLPIHGGMGA